jgi:hypothetical protein
MDLFPIAGKFSQNSQFSVVAVIFPNITVFISENFPSGQIQFACNISSFFFAPISGKIEKKISLLLSV